MNAELKAANTLLEKGIRFAIKAPRLLRLIGIKKINVTLRHPHAGTLYYISKYFLEMGIDPDQLEGQSYAQAFERINKGAVLLSKVLAVSILDSFLMIKLFTRLLAFLLRWSLTPVVQHQLFAAVIQFSGTEVFLNTIRLAGEIRTTTPKNLSQTEKGS